MTTPTKSEILAKASEMWKKYQDQCGASELSLTTPEEHELKEDGFFSAAVSELMSSPFKKYEEFGEPEKSNKESENFDRKTIDQSIVEGVPFNIPTAMDSGFYISGTSQSGKTNLAKHLVQKLINAGITCYVMDTSQAWSHDTPVKNVVAIDVDTDSYSITSNTILDISTLNTRQKVAFVNLFCRTIYEQHVQGYRAREFIVFEEAQTYLPQSSMRLAIRHSSPCESVLDVVTVGANYGLRFGLITQFPALVDKPPVKITQQRYFGWTWEKNDVAYIKGFLDKTWIEKLQGLQKGQFIYQKRDMTELIQVPLFETKSEPIAQFNYACQFEPISSYRKA